MQDSDKKRPEAPDEGQPGPTAGAARVAVTGAAGLLGRPVVAALSRTWQVEGVDLQAAAGASHLEADVRDLDRMVEVLSDVDAVVHLAGLDSVVEAPADRFFDVNAIGSWTVCEAARRAGVATLVYCSSASVYGLDFTNPEVRPSYLPIDEDHPIYPSQPYGLSKRFAEIAGETYAWKHGLSITSLRVSAVYRPPELAALRQSLAETSGDDTQGRSGAPDRLESGSYSVPRFRSYVAASDAAEAFAAALEHAEPGYRVLNICADDTLVPYATLELLASLLGDLPPVKRPALYEAWPRAAAFSNARAREVIGWTPEITLDALSEFRPLAAGGAP